jgi:hypothetical protein
MSVEQIDIIDFISTSPDGKIVLTISDHLLWDEKNEHLWMLQEKLNSYLRFIENGEIFESYPAAKANSLIIDIAVQYEPNEVGLAFLNRCKETIVNAGIGFKWRQIKR